MWLLFHAREPHLMLDQYIHYYIAHISWKRVIDSCALHKLWFLTYSNMPLTRCVARYIKQEIEIKFTWFQIMWKWGCVSNEKLFYLHFFLPLLHWWKTGIGLGPYEPRTSIKQHNSHLYVILCNWSECNTNTLIGVT